MRESKDLCNSLAGEDNSLEMIALAPATCAFFKLRGPATAAVWVCFHYAKKYFVMIDQPTVEVYPSGNRQAEDYEMEIWIPIKEEV
ncbi:AraC family transcriptional regulator [Streptococcus vestibularis]|uniref:AraC family transcriptional regulator n=1 Tax=Streptococcus vestibularis TaxID=1343 RepID=UPI001D0B924B|nr:AraC family transcriptional regulator [Streptococcus vestibularis]MCB8555601.1 AraC family transcriptional regulator [Streptococcus vestibularis]MCB8586454.1 AraC family transcriptional regulator [Streptococcus vestibularis]